MQNPFSTTFSRLPEHTYITTTEPREIIDNFSYDSPTESVYKITGVRGSGKTVILSYVQNELCSEDNKKKGWLVYTLNPSRDMLSQFAASLYKEKFIHEAAKSSSFNLQASVWGTGGGIGFAREENDIFTDIGVEIKKMLEVVQNKHKKILLCVDEVSRTPEMIVFALEFAGWLIAGFPVFIVCTGLYENIQALGNVKNLTFFRRGKSIKTKPLNMIRMSEMYRSRLKVDIETAKELAAITKGYAYAFQELGSLCFKSAGTFNIDEIADDLKRELFSYSYEKIWEELSLEDKYLLRLLTGKAEYKRDELLTQMGEKSRNYSVYRDRLLKRGLISTRRGYIGLSLPFFAEYIEEYGL